MLKYIKDTVKNSAIYGIGNISVKLVGIILIPFLTNPEYLSSKDFGALAILEAINQIAVYIMGMGLYNAMYRWYYEQNKKEQKASFFTVILTSSLIVLFIFSAVLIWKTELTDLFFATQQYRFVLLLTIFSTGLQAISLIPATLMRLQDKAAFFTTTNVIKLIATLLATLYFLLWKNDGLIAIYYGQIVGFIFYLLIITPYIFSNSIFKIHIPVFTEMFGYGFSMMIAAISAASINVLDRFVLKSMTGLEEAGLYTLGYKVTSILKVFVIGSVSMALVPLIFKKINDSDSKRFYTKTMTYYGFGMMFCIIGVSLFSKEAIKVFTNSPFYWSSFSVVPILAFSLYFVALKDVAVTGLHITKKTSRISFVTAIVSGLNLGLNIFMIPYFGAQGAALASLFSQLLFFLGLLYYSHKHYPINYEWRKIVLMFVVGLVLVYGALLTSEQSLAVRLIVKTIALMLFPVLLYPFNFYEEVEIQQINSIWHKWRNPIRWPTNIKELFS